MNQYYTLLRILLLAPLLGSSIGEAAEPIRIPGPDGTEVALYQGHHALLIGASDYVNGWPKLPGVLDDLQAVRSVLEAHGFTVTEVRDPDHLQLPRAFDDFIQAYGDVADNRLLFYFAGHGETLAQRFGGEMGYIVPVDAPNPALDRPGFLATALDMQQIEVYARRIQSKHALFLFDSCFSGSLFALSRAAPEHIAYKAARPVRQFITSGSADEEVPDQSIFRAQFVAALNGEADSTGDGYVTGTELGMFLQDTVVNYSRGSQHPQYGTIRDSRLDKGDFVFQLAEGALPAVRPAVPSPNTESASAPRAPQQAEPWYASVWSWVVEQWAVIFSGIGTAMVVGVLGWVVKRFFSSAPAAQPAPAVSRKETITQSPEPVPEKASPATQHEDKPDAGRCSDHPSDTAGDRSRAQAPSSLALDLLNQLIPSQFESVKFNYEVPKEHIPQRGTQNEQAIAVIEYARQREGETLAQLLNTIYQVAPHLKRG